MTPLIGAAICVALLLVGRSLGSPILVGLLASLAFGSTTFATISAMGGASPLIYVVFEMAACLAVAMRPTVGRDLAILFEREWEPWVVLALLVYAPVSTFILPRLFAGQVNAFVSSHDTGVVEVALAPTSGNVTQAGYFCLGLFTFMAVGCLLDRPGSLAVLRRSYVAWAACVCAGGLIDLFGKAAGLGDVLAPIRTAAFAYLTNTEQAGFFRIAGSFSETSSFAAAAVAALGFCFVDWRCTGSRVSGGLSAALLLLLSLATSSTGYGGIAGLGLLLACSIGRNAVTGRLRPSDLWLFTGLVVAMTAILAAVAFNERLVRPFQDLIQATVIDKMDSESGHERSYWNERSLMTVPQTWGLGIGLGSSRASNWLVALVSQLGVIGTALQLSLMAPIVLRMPRRPAQDGVAGLDTSLRVCAAALLLGAVLAGGSADPGALFFISLAGILACRRQARSLPISETGRHGGAADTPCVRSLAGDVHVTAARRWTRPGRVDGTAARDARTRPG